MVRVDEVDHGPALRTGRQNASTMPERLQTLAGRDRGLVAEKREDIPVARRDHFRHISFAALHEKAGEIIREVERQERAIVMWPRDRLVRCWVVEEEPELVQVATAMVAGPDVRIAQMHREPVDYLARKAKRWFSWK